MTQSHRAFLRDRSAATLRSWREMISPANLPADLSAGLTVALVALPLNIALAIACGAPAATGVITAVVAGVVAGMFGGSHLAVTGPAAAMVPLCAEIIARHGLRGLVVAAFLAGVLQVLLGLLRVGRLVQSIPVSVVAGFMSGIGLLILGGQIPRLLGLPPEVKSIGAIAKNPALLGAVSPLAVGAGLVVLAALVLLPRVSKKVPAALIGLAAVTGIVVFANIQLPSVGAIPRSVPLPRLPSLAGLDLVALMPEVFALTALASIESLLSAVAVDTMARTPRHSSDQELVGQGLANMTAALFGGLPVTGVIVRSSVAVQSGGRTRMTPVSHSIAILLMMLVAAPVVARVPIAALGGLLVFIGLRLLEWRELAKMWSISRFEAVVFLVTMAGIVFFDFIDGILVGVVLSLVHFAHTQRVLGVATVPLHELEELDEEGELPRLMGSDPGANVSVVRIEGPLFFVSHTGLESLAARDDLPEFLVFDLSGVPFIDVTGLETLRAQIRALADRGTRVLVARPSEPVRLRLVAAKVDALLHGERTHETVASALSTIALTHRPPRPTPPLVSSPSIQPA